MFYNLLSESDRPSFPSGVIMKRKLIAAAFSATLAASFASAASAAYYRYDDGQTDTSMGPPSSFPQDPQTGWGNYFVAPAGGDEISAIQIAFGPTWPTRGPVNVYLFEDADDDFNPGNATLLTSVTDTPAQIGLSIFNTFTFPTPMHVDGGFFVLATTDTAKGLDRMAAQDTSGRTDRSWLIYNPRTVGINTSNLAANALFSPAAPLTAIDGVYMIRAIGVPEPTTLAAVAGAGAIALHRRRR